MTLGKKIGLIILVMFGVISFVFFRAMVRFGEFTNLTPRFDGKCDNIIQNVAGIEDGAIFQYDGANKSQQFIALSAQNRAVKPIARGAIYISPINQINVESDASKIINGDKLEPQPREFNPIGIGAIGGKKPIIMVVNNRELASFVEIFKIDGDGILSHVKSVEISGASRLNDVSPLSENSFYVTNESDIAANSFSNFLSIFLDNDKSGSIFYYDGAKVKKIPADIGFANSVALSNDGSKLYLSGTLSRNLQIYSRNIANNEIQKIDDVFLGTGVDNINVDNEDRLLIGAHPKIWSLLWHMKFGGKNVPNQIIVVEPNKNAKGGNVDQVYLDKGENGFGAASFAIKNANRLLMGSTYSNGLKSCELPQEWHQSKAHPAQKLIDVDRDAKIKKERELDLKGG